MLSRPDVEREVFSDDFVVAEKIDDDGALAVFPRENAESAVFGHDVERGVHAATHLIEFLIEDDAKRLKRELGGVHHLVLFALGFGDEGGEILRRARKRAVLPREKDGVGDASGGDGIGRLAVFVNHATKFIARYES